MEDYQARFNKAALVMKDARNRAQRVYQEALQAGFTFGAAERAFQAVLRDHQAAFDVAINDYNKAVGAWDLVKS